MAVKNKSDKERIDFRYNLSLYFSFLKKYKPIFFILLLVILVIEATSVADKFLFKAIIDNGTDFSSNLLVKDAFIKILTIIALVYLVMILVRTILKFLYIHLINLLDSGMIADMKRSFFNHLLTLDYGFHTTHKTGSLISKLLRIGGAVERMTDVLIFNFSPLIFQLSVAFFSLVYFSWKTAVISLVTVLIFIGYSFIMQRIQEKANIASNEAEDKEKAGVSDIFTNIESIKYFGKENLIKARFRKLSELTKVTTSNFWEYFRWLDAIQVLILSLGVFFIVYFSILDFLAGKSTLGTLVFTYTVFTSLVASLFSFVWGIRNFYRAMADFQSIFKFAKIKMQ